MRILYGKVENLTKEVRQMGKGFLTKERNEQLHKYRMEADKKRCFGAGLLLYYVFFQYGIKPDQVVFQKTKDGKPYFREYPWLHFNLSHAGNYVAAVFDEKEVGIDVEKNDRCNLKVAERFFQQKELEYLTEEKDLERRQERFGLLWTRKESYIKATGYGMRQELNSFCVLDSVEGEWFFHTFSLEEGYQLSVCTSREKIECRPEFIDFVKLVKGEKECTIS